MISVKLAFALGTSLFSTALWAKDKADENTHKSSSIISQPTLMKDAPIVPIKMWTSRDGGKKQENIREQVNIGGLYFDGLIAYDLQYEKTLHFRGLKLRDLITQYKPIPSNIDFILLHSKLGMIIPVPIKNLREDSEVFIALALFDDNKKAWGTNFPSSVYSQADQSEQVSLSFTGNKMVVGKNWRHTDFAITPWRFFDSLAGIEFVSSIDYYKALQPKSQNSEVAGRSVYMRRCQYCHGVGDFGAKFGPNFAVLIPGDKKKAVEMILNKVLPAKKEQGKPHSSGSRMPKQGDFNKNEAQDLVRWIHSWNKK